MYFIESSFEKYFKDNLLNFINMTTENPNEGEISNVETESK